MSTDRDIAIGFLTRILPAEGPYSLRYRTGKTFMKKEPAYSITELWDMMSQHGDVMASRNIQTGHTPPLSNSLASPPKHWEK